MFVVNFSSQLLENVLNKEGLLAQSGKVQIGTDSDMVGSRILPMLATQLKSEMKNVTVSLPMLYFAFDYYYRYWLGNLTTESGDSLSKATKLDLVQMLTRPNWGVLAKNAALPIVVSMWADIQTSWFTASQNEEYDATEDLRVLGMLETSTSPADYQREGVPIGCCLTGANGSQLRIISLKLSNEATPHEIYSWDLDLEEQFLKSIRLNIELNPPKSCLGTYKIGDVEPRSSFNDFDEIGGYSTSESFWQERVYAISGKGQNLGGTNQRTSDILKNQVTYFNSLFEPYISQDGLAVYVAPIFVLAQRYRLHRLARELAESLDRDEDYLLDLVLTNTDGSKEDLTSQISAWLASPTVTSECEEYLSHKQRSLLRPLLSVYGLHNANWIKFFGINPDTSFKWPKYDGLLSGPADPFQGKIQVWLQDNICSSALRISLSGMSIQQIIKGRSTGNFLTDICIETSLRNMVLYMAIYRAQRNQGV